MINYLIGFFTNTIAQLKIDCAVKKFDLNDFEILQEKLRPESFAPILVTTYGNWGSNFLIRTAQWFGIKKWSNKTHVAIWIGDGKIIEADGTFGIRKMSLLKAIGQRDEVKVMRSYVSKKVNDEAQKYLLKVLELDSKKPIEYDNEHNLDDVSAYDCAEVFYHAYNFGLKSEGYALLKPIKRAGKKTYAPIDVEFCRFLRPVYDSENGGFL